MCNSTNTPHVFYVETMWKRPFPRRCNVEYMWCGCWEIVLETTLVLVFSFFFLKWWYLQVGILLNRGGWTISSCKILQKRWGSRCLWSRWASRVLQSWSNMCCVPWHLCQRSGMVGVQFTYFFYKQSIFDPRPQKLFKLKLSKTPPQIYCLAIV